MAEYFAPGVYVEELAPGAAPIAGVGTSTAGFIGVVADAVTMPAGQTLAPAGTPKKLANWSEFKNHFGDVQAGNQTLALALYGFFANGGTSCWVLRVAAEADLTNVADDLEKFEPIDEIAIVAVPGALSAAQQNAIAAHCKKMEDRVCILDGQPNPANYSVADIKGATQDNDYAALYFPWIKVFNPITETLISQPPSGHLAGIYARVDAQRGVFKAPANEPVVGALDLDHKLTRAHQVTLNPLGINVIRSFEGNIKVYGARTLGGTVHDGMQMRYISTRRYLNFLRESIDEGTQFVVFEPNNPALWERIKRSVSGFLYGQWRDGALFGTTADKAFYVKCDAETNPPETREAGQVITEIGVAIVKPAEFVVFRIQQIAGA